MSETSVASRRLRLVAAMAGGDAQVVWTSPQGARLWLGSAAASLAESIEEKGIGAVVRIMTDNEADPELERQPSCVPGVRTLWIREPDRPSADLLPFFEHTCAFLDRHFREASGSRSADALVHCVMGASRSASVVAAYLLHLQRPKPAPVTTVVCQLRERRGVVGPNAGFLKQLEQWRLHLCGEESAMQIHASQQPSSNADTLRIAGNDSHELPVKSQQDIWARSCWAAWRAQRWTQPSGFLLSRSLGEIVEQTEQHLLAAGMRRALEWVLGTGAEPLKASWMEDLLSSGSAKEDGRGRPGKHELQTVVEELLLTTLLNQEWLETWDSDVPALVTEGGLAARWLVASDCLSSTKQRVAEKRESSSQGLVAQVVQYAEALQRKAPSF